MLYPTEILHSSCLHGLLLWIFFGFSSVGSRSYFIAKSNSSSEASSSQTGFFDFRLFLGLSSSLPRDHCPKTDKLVILSHQLRVNGAKTSRPKPPGGTGDKRLNFAFLGKFASNTTLAYIVAHSLRTNSPQKPPVPHSKP